MKKLPLIMTSLAAAFLFSCSDDDDRQNNNDPLQEADLRMMRASSNLDRLMAIDFSTAINLLTADSQNRMTGFQSASDLPSCAVMTEQTGPNDTFPKTYTIDFGDGCTDNGITRSGILIITLDNDFYVNGSTMTISHDNYVLNDHAIEGEIVYVNQSSSPLVPQWTTTITNGEVTDPDGEIFIHNGTRSVRQIGGVATPENWSDNIYESTSGTHVVTKPNGATLTATILTPLIKDESCEHVSQGTADLQGEYLDGTFDFGNGNCDNQATYTHSDGEVDVVTL